MAGGVPPGRASRTVLLSILAPGIGAELFSDADDIWLTLVPFVLVVLATSALTAELTRQGQRGSADGWAGTDTAIVLTLAVLAALLSASAAFARTPPSEHTAAACFAALYFLLAGYFWYVRRKTLAG